MGILLEFDRDAALQEGESFVGVAGSVRTLFELTRPVREAIGVSQNYYRIDPHVCSDISLEQAKTSLSQLQSSKYQARLVLPYSARTLELVTYAARYGWKWHVEGVTTLTQAVSALEAGAAGLWMQVGQQDTRRELAGDELCSQVARFVDEHYQSKQNRPLVVASDLPDLEHADRMLEFGCDHVVLSQALWNSVVAPTSNLS